MRSDCHIHALGNEDPSQVLRAMDAAKLDVICAISRAPASTSPDLASVKSMGDDRSRMREISRIASGDRNRVRSFFWLDLAARDAADQVERTVAEFSISAIKIIPDHYHVHEERFFPVFERIQKMGVPVLFHTGILWGNMDSSRFCRPCDLEILQNFPRIRWMMAHVSWPWTDECIAVADRFKTMARHAQKLDPALRKDYAARDVALHDPAYEPDVVCKVDLTPGTPEIYRSEVLTTAWKALGTHMLLFGTDGFGADNFKDLRRHQERDERIFRDELGLSEADIDRIMGTNLLRMFEPVSS